MSHKYQAIASFIPNSPDELAFNAGDILALTEFYDDGWANAINQSNFRSGLVSGNFIVPAGAQIDNPANPPLPFPRISSQSSRSSVPQTPIQAHVGVGTGSTFNFTNPISAIRTSNYNLNMTANRSLPGSLSNMADSSSDRSVPTEPVTNTVVMPPKFTQMSDSECKDFVVKRLEETIRLRSLRERAPNDIGTIKISVTGDSGIGKTRLIDSFLEMNQFASREPTISYLEMDPRLAIREIRGSTISADEERPNEERQNVCFVDTPGFGSYINALATIDPVIEYHDKEFQRTDQFFSRQNPSSKSIISFITSGTGGSNHVDLCLYGILHRLKPVDIEFMRRLSSVVTIVPVIMKCDAMRKNELFQLKTQILSELGRAGIRVFGFGLEMWELLVLARNQLPGAVPFAISNYAIMNEDPGPLSELETLQKLLLFQSLPEIRYWTAETFVKWRTVLIEKEEAERKLLIENQRAQEEKRLLFEAKRENEILRAKAALEEKAREEEERRRQEDEFRRLQEEARARLEAKQKGNEGLAKWFKTRH
ncbi:Septin-domain-containing protein [Polychytrium aggregatum]|uniref:Septin-domain-containing protein n=1 Tax=Polychytrium aggregatum TaxID=110093 RepID=UPI0022FE7914|nr:Septin-domain-containing protein [Polychytrium aggregatum]KAI9193373.1 Septin-domain-containing protein [Polychytrium aggregatum]